MKLKFKIQFPQFPAPVTPQEAEEGPPLITATEISATVDRVGIKA